MPELPAELPNGMPVVHAIQLNLVYARCAGADLPIALFADLARATALQLEISLAGAKHHAVQTVAKALALNPGRLQRVAIVAMPMLLNDHPERTN